MKLFLQTLKQHLLSGVSFAIPFIACGGILIALSITFSPMTGQGPDFSHSVFWRTLNVIGNAAFTLMLPVLAGYIANSVAGRPGLAPGFVGGWLCADINAGFIGALIVGLVAGYLAQWIKQWRVPLMLRPVMPILIIPIVASALTGFLVVAVVGPPVAALMVSTGEWLRDMSAGNGLLLAVILGGMIAFDMGGPVNKTAFFFGAAMIKEGNAAVMGCVAAAIATPPLGMGLATLMMRRLWSDEQREAGTAALAMGAIGITEGAIPFGAAEPLRVIPCLMLGSMSAAALAMWGAVGDHAPHGGLVVLPVVEHKIWYIFAIVTGSLVTASAVNFIKLLQRKKST
ncbi:MAG: PTS fructose transporter subunit IIC [Verrucomicrobiales bacterium]|jgi:fructose-specific phosphotransferase system IIC component|nr:PTS fructose transporter subunit IIC [Verrucomicrobiales bacterium]